MNEAQFWTLIDDARNQHPNDRDAQTQALTDALAKLSKADMIAYDKIFHDLHNKANQASLWNAAYLVLSGCGDDAFMDVRSWLISMGKTVYENALADPDNLADVIEERHWDDYELEYEEFAYIVYDAYQQKTGEEFPMTPTNRTELVGELVDDEDELIKMFPRLAAKIGIDDD